MENVNRLISYKKQQKNVTQVVFIFTIQPANIGTLPLVLTIMHTLGVDGLRLHKRSPQDSSFLKDIGYYNLIQNTFTKTKQLADNYGYVISFPEYKLEKEFTREANNIDALQVKQVKEESLLPLVPIVNTYYCAYGENKIELRINHDLEVIVPCFKHPAPLGNLKKNTFEEIQASPEYLKFYNCSIDTPTTECLTCCNLRKR